MVDNRGGEELRAGREGRTHDMPVDPEAWDRYRPPQHRLREIGLWPGINAIIFALLAHLFFRREGAGVGAGPWPVGFRPPGRRSEAVQCP